MPKNSELLIRVYPESEGTRLSPRDISPSISCVYMRIELVISNVVSQIPLGSWWVSVHLYIIYGYASRAPSRVSVSPRKFGKTFPLSISLFCAFSPWVFCFAQALWWILVPFERSFEGTEHFSCHCIYTSLTSVKHFLFLMSAYGKA